MWTAEKGSTHYTKAVVEVIPNQIARALDVLADQATQTMEAVTQNWLVLDYLLAEEGGVSNIGQPRKTTLSPAQLDPFYTQGDSLTSEDHLDDTWVTVFGFPQASASYILLQFAQYGNILKHVMSNTGNWMHIRYQSKLQARKALSKDGRIFGESIMIGVKPCIDKSVMETFALVIL
ncbi:nucleoporin NUP35-like [Trichosurus vulpecula]|uniref:nucleoporin NUP35-like n=1 Tax=Trichosurus vulpecula TaxID=9337 RepID=UPI00186AF4E9|nr:nucleoporin NUP35-like [Trichosurus vulpecula]